MEIEVLLFDAQLKYLGPLITFADLHARELTHRMAAAWRKFVSLKQELTSNMYPLKHRMKLFQCVVMPTALYGSAAWTLRKPEELVLLRTQRRMLRMMLGSKRRLIQRTDDGQEQLESWVDWMKRTTNEAENLMRSLKYDTWVDLHKAAKLAWQQEIDACSNFKWSHKLRMWDPQFCVKTFRARGRPKKRWSDQ